MERGGGAYDRADFSDDDFIAYNPLHKRQKPLTSLEKWQRFKPKHLARQHACPFCTYSISYPENCVNMCDFPPRLWPGGFIEMCWKAGDNVIEWERKYKESKSGCLTCLKLRCFFDIEAKEVMLYGKLNICNDSIIAFENLRKSEKPLTPNMQ